MPWDTASLTVLSLTVKSGINSSWLPSWVSLVSSSRKAFYCQVSLEARVTIETQRLGCPIRVTEGTRRSPQSCRVRIPGVTREILKTDKRTNCHRRDTLMQRPRVKIRFKVTDTVTALFYLWMSRPSQLSYSCDLCWLRKTELRKNNCSLWETESISVCDHWSNGESIGRSIIKESSSLSQETHSYWTRGDSVSLASLKHQPRLVSSSSWSQISSVIIIHCIFIWLSLLSGH